MLSLFKIKKQNTLFLCCFLFLTFLAPTPGESQIISHISPSNKQVLLTIDDGPHPGYTERILSLLAAQKVKANFFVVGKMAATYPYLVRKIAEHGHTVANHSYYHNNLTALPEENMPLEWIMCNATIHSILGAPPRFCRPPGGNYNDHVINAAEKENLHTILWTANAGDCTGISAKTITRKVLQRVHPGGIILVHDGVDATIEALPDIIETLRAKGYHFVTLDEVMPPPGNAQRASASPETIFAAPNQEKAEKVGDSTSNYLMP